MNTSSTCQMSPSPGSPESQRDILLYGLAGNHLLRCRPGYRFYDRSVRPLYWLPQYRWRPGSRRGSERGRRAHVAVGFDGLLHLYELRSTNFAGRGRGLLQKLRHFRPHVYAHGGATYRPAPEPGVRPFRGQRVSSAVVRGGWKSRLPVRRAGQGGPCRQLHHPRVRKQEFTVVRQG